MHSGPRTKPSAAGDIAAWFAAKIQTFQLEIRSRRLAPDVAAERIRSRLAAYTFGTPLSLAEALGDACEMLDHWTLHATHPGYFGLFVPNTHQAGIWGDAL